MELKFRLWLEKSSSTGTRARQGLYPSLYTQVFNYPPSDIATWAADFMAYMQPEDIHCPHYSNWGKFKPYFWHDLDKV